MAFLELVKKRGSCRRYSSATVERDVLIRCLEAARLAPSACNSQPWKFIIIQDPQLKDRIAEQAFSGVHGMNAFAKQAPVLVAVVRERAAYAVRLGASLRQVDYSLIDVGSACEHFVLQAAEEGLGTCWLGWFNEKNVKKELGLPNNTKIDVMISVGYPENTDEPGEKNRKKLEQMSDMR